LTGGLRTLGSHCFSLGARVGDPGEDGDPTEEGDPGDDSAPTEDGDPGDDGDPTDDSDSAEDGNAILS
jgi:hypothetical protein